MGQLIENIKKNFDAETQVLKENKQAIDKRNLRILQLIFIGCMAIFSVNFLLALSRENSAFQAYTDLRLAYFLVIIVSGGLYALTSRFKDKGSIWAIYFSYTLAIIYCIFTSAFVTPDYTSVVILAVLFQFPVLYLDKSWRITLFVIFGAVCYLVAIAPFKNPVLFVDEAVNAFAFSTSALLIGGFTRASMLENFSIKAKLQFYAYTDPLTRLSNRRKLFEDLMECETNEQSQLSGYAIFDIDFFKRYNDTYGHQAGDECLYRIADCFLQFQQKYTMSFYRYGGEEFLAVFYQYHETRMCEITQEISASVQDLKIPHTGSHLGFVTISAGVAAFQEKQTKKYSALLSQADKALYTAKEQGRNCMVLYQVPVNELYHDG